MEDSTLEGKQNLEVIQEMIETSRHNFKEEAPYFLIWGWAVMIAALLHYALLAFAPPFNPAWVWPAFLLLAYITYTVTLVKNQKAKQRKTFVDRTLGGIWLGITGPIIICIVMGFQFGWPAAYPALIATFGWGTVSTGIIMQFRPMIIGGLLNFGIALVTIFSPPQEILLMLALAILVSYLIPGYMLKYKA